MKGIVITTKDDVKIRNFGEPLYKTVGEMVGGTIEVVHPMGLDEPYVMIVDDEGLIKKYGVNVIGSMLYGTPIHGHPIVGDVVIMKTGWTPEGPDIVGLDREEADKLFDQFINLK